MAIDVYLKLDGIDGESTDAGGGSAGSKGSGGHQKWIECLAVNFEVLQPKSATASTAGGFTAERCEHKDIVITKLCDIATPKLLQLCSSGKTIKEAFLEFMRADNDQEGKRITYFTIKLTNVLISGVAPHVGEGQIMTETLSLKYSEVVWKYNQQKIAGGQGGSMSGGWNLSTNKIAA
jgi:type VI secretion system secreted protein Hcp